MLVIDGLGKRYEGDRWALRDVTLRPGPGILGLVGPNGAGKSTLLRMLATVLAPTEGMLRWDGEDLVRRPQALRRTLGYLPQDFGVYPQLTAREFLRYVGELKGLYGAMLGRQIEHVLELVDLRGDAGRRLRAFSGGMVRRLGIAQALLSEPRLLVLDEPTAGLDPAERMRFRSALASLAGERLVVLSTHIISDIEATATDVALLQRGRLTWFGTPEGLLADVEGQVWSLLLPAGEFERLRMRCTISAAQRRGDAVQVRIVAQSRPHPLAIPAAPALEDAYMRFAGSGGDGAGGGVR